MSDSRPILVTGSHRSGTTWVGKMLAASPRVAYISEPLNVNHRPGVFSAPVPYWYQVINENNETKYLPAFQSLLEYRYHVFDEIKSLRSHKDAARMGRDALIFAKGKVLKQRPLLKDPFAVFSATWFAQRLNCHIVITVRHPAAFAGSLKKLNWPFDFANLLNQRGEVPGLTAQDSAEMEAMDSRDIIGQAALLWRIIHRFVHLTRNLFPLFNIVRHEDLSLDPLAGYADLYEKLGLQFTEDVQRTILNSSSAENPAELSRQTVHSVKLDSRASVGSWKKKLGADEIARIREITAPVSGYFYSDAEW